MKPLTKKSLELGVLNVCFSRTAAISSSMHRVSPPSEGVLWIIYVVRLAKYRKVIITI